MAKRPEEQLAEMIANLPVKTGKSLNEWLTIISETGLGRHKEIRTYLQEQHQVGYGYANQIALRAVHGDSASPNSDPAETLYVGSKVGLRPIHEALMAQIQSFGDDVNVALKKGYLSIRRTKQFAMIQPSTITRVDLGIILHGAEPNGRLESSGAWNAMFTHRIKLGDAADVDAEVVSWLHKAYEAAQ